MLKDADLSLDPRLQLIFELRLYGLGRLEQAMKLCGVSAMDSLFNVCLWLVLVLRLGLRDVVFHEAEVLLYQLKVLLRILDYTLKLRFLNLLV